VIPCELNRAWNALLVGAQVEGSGRRQDVGEVRGGVEDPQAQSHKILAKRGPCCPGPRSVAVCSERSRVPRTASV